MNDYRDTLHGETAQVFVVLHRLEQTVFVELFRQLLGDQVADRVVIRGKRPVRELNVGNAVLDEAVEIGHKFDGLGAISGVLERIEDALVLERRDQVHQIEVGRRHRYAGEAGLSYTELRTGRLENTNGVVGAHG